MDLYSNKQQKGAEDTKASAVWLAFFLVGLILVAAFCTPAHAEMYLTVGLGKGELRHPGTNEWWIQKGWDYTIDQDSTVYSVGLGKQFNKYLGVELNYHNLGKYNHFAGFMMSDEVYDEGSPAQCAGECLPTHWGYLRGSAKAFSLSVLPRLPITKDLSVFARWGVARYSAKFDIFVVPPVDPMGRRFQHNGSLSQTGTTRIYGLGLTYKQLTIEAQQLPKLYADNGECCSAYRRATTKQISYRWEF